MSASGMYLVSVIRDRGELGRAHATHLGVYLNVAFRIDDETNDLLTLVADLHSPIGADAPDLFLDACRRDAMANDGYVSVNRVRVLLAAHDIPSRRYSSLWSAFTGVGKPMAKSSEWETCEGSTSGNDGRPFRLRRWTG